MLNKFRKSEFTRSEASYFTGVKVETLKNWVRHGYLKPISHSKKRDGWRKFTFLELVRMIIINEFTKSGISPSYASLLAEFAERDLEKEDLNKAWILGKYHDQALTAVEGDERLSEYHSTGEAIHENKSKGPIIILPLKPIISQLYNAIKEELELLLDD